MGFMSRNTHQPPFEHQLPLSFDYTAVHWRQEMTPAVMDYRK